MDIHGKKGRLRGAQDAGREKLLEAARSLFRSKVTREVSRLEIARHAGVAPSLLTYYFATKSDLVLAATRPIMAEAIEKLITTISSSTPPEERLKQSAVLFINFARTNSPILDLFVEAVLESGDDSGQALIYSCIDKLGQFFLQAVQAELISKDTDPHMLLLAMWGMCRLVGETPPLPIQDTVGVKDREDMAAEFITRLILYGGKGQPSIG